MGVSMCVCARLCLCLCLRVCLCACVFMFVSLNVYAKVCGIAHEAGSYKYTPCVYIYVHAYSACANTTPIFSLGETCVSACRWNMLDQDHRMGMPGQDQNQFLSQLYSVSLWITLGYH